MGYMCPIFNTQIVGKCIQTHLYGIVVAASSNKYTADLGALQNKDSKLLRAKKTGEL